MIVAHCLAVLLCLLASACSAGEPGSPSDSGAEETDDWEWVTVVGFANPGVWSEGEDAMDALGAALGGEGIRWCAAGSAYWSL